MLDNNQTISQPTEAESKTAEPGLVAQVKVHTMPEKFLKNLPRIKIKKSGIGIIPGIKAKSSGIKKNIMNGTIIGLIFVLAIAVAAFFFLRSIKQQSMVEDSNLLIQPTNEQKIEEQEKLTDLKPEQICSSDNCEACGIEQCKMIQDTCTVEVIFKPCENEPTEDCAYEKCVFKPFKEKEDEQRFSQEEYDEEDLSSDQNFLSEEFKSSKDTDGDGLTDIEEELWQTNVNNQDTDNDLYLDGQEIYNLYNPIKSNSITLKQDSLIKIFLSQNFGYRFYYPSKFELNVREGNESNIIVKSTSTQEFFNVLILDNETEMTDVNDWYLLQNPYAKINNIINRDVGGKKSVVTENGLNVYVLVNQKIFLLSYYPGIRNELNFMTTFSMFLNSFEFFESPF